MTGGLTAPAAAHHDGDPEQYPETCEGPGFNDTPILPERGWRFGDACRPTPPVVDPGQPMFSDPPADATVLLGDGSNGEITLDNWEDRNGNPSQWTVTDNYVAVNPDAGWLQSKETIGDAHYHVEWRIPEDVSGSGQGAGNSGVWLASNYEIQVLNSYQNQTYADGMAGALYGEHPPLVNAARPPGEWQKYDIIWHAPRFTDNGDVESRGMITVFWNDILVQSQTVVHGSTPYKAVPEYHPHPVEMPLQLQNHGHPVQYRNIWYQSLPTAASVLDFGGNQLTAEQTSSTLDASLTNSYSAAITNGKVTLTSPEGSDVAVTPKANTFEAIAPGKSQSISWEVTRPSADSGPHLLDTSTSYSIKGDQQGVEYRIPVYPQPTSQTPSKKESYGKTVLSDRMNNLIDLAIADDGRVFYITRGDFFTGVVGGTTEIGVIDPETNEDTVVLELDVFTGIRMEDGGQGIALDPNFDENGWLYIYYSPSNKEIADTQEELEYLNKAGQNGDKTVSAPDEPSAEPYNLLSRVTMEGGTINPDSEVEILRVPVQRDLCCHEGGDIQWGPDGENLYLTTGDNTYSKAQTDAPGFAPLDEREGRAYYDAQRSAADTSDLRGKILRITPQDDGSYTIPDGNLFTGSDYADERENGTVLPEIYVMGARNPYQASVDSKTGTLFWGDYSADSRVWSDTRGPPGFNEFNRATSAGNYGWPHFSGPYPYFDYNYETQKSGNRFDASSPVNDSPHSDGIEQLPAVTEPFIWYPGKWNLARKDVPDVYDLPPEVPFPDFEGGAPIGGPVFRYQDDFTERGLPPWHDGDYIIAEFGNNWLRTVSFEGGDVAEGEIDQINPLAPDVKLDSPIDVEIGPDGMLYVAEYGNFSGKGSKVSRIERQEDSGDGKPKYIVPKTDGGTANEPAFTLAPEGDTYMDLDGDADTSGPDDLSADVYLGYDADNLYLWVEVTDDVHAAMSGANMWQADSIQWAVASDGTYGPEYGLSHVDGNTSIHRWIAGNATADTSAIDASTSRNGTTTYKASIPWNALFAESKGPSDSFPFSVLVNEQDKGSSRDAVLGWTLPGISDQKTPEALGTLVLGSDDGDGDQLPPIVGDSPPTDPNDDGLYEDVNGDGEVNYDDVVDLFDHFEDDAVQNNPDAYDFNGNGRLDFDDITELYRSL
jgi:glucose/arabinose dehydrogenase